MPHFWTNPGSRAAFASCSGAVLLILISISRSAVQKLPHTANATIAANVVSRERTRPLTNETPTVRFHHGWEEQTAIPKSSLSMVWFTAKLRQQRGFWLSQMILKYHVLFQPHCYGFQGNSVEKNGCQRWFPSSSHINWPTGPVCSCKTVCIQWTNAHKGISLRWTKP